MTTIPEIARAIIETISLETGEFPAHPFPREGSNSDATNFLLEKLKLARRRAKWEMGTSWPDSRVDFTPVETAAILGQLAVEAETDQYSRRRTHLHRFGINAKILEKAKDKLILAS